MVEEQIPNHPRLLRISDDDFIESTSYIPYPRPSSDDGLPRVSLDVECFKCKQKRRVIGGLDFGDIWGGYMPPCEEGLWCQACGVPMVNFQDLVFLTYRSRETGEMSNGTMAVDDLSPEDRVLFRQWLSDKATKLQEDIALTVAWALIGEEESRKHRLEYQGGGQ